MTLSKTFVTEFKNKVIIEPLPISKCSFISEDELMINDNTVIQGYAKKDKNIIFISLMGRKALQSPSKCCEDIINSEIFCNPTLLNDGLNVYWLIYKTKNNYAIFNYDYNKGDSEVKHLVNYSLANLNTVFNDVNLINSDKGIRNEIADVIQSIWNNMHCGSDKRMVFIILTWLLLEHKDIPFVNVLNELGGGTLSLSQYFDKIKENADNLDTDEGIERYTKWNKFFHTIKGNHLINAFRSIYTYKLREQMDDNNEIMKKQMKFFNETIDAIQNQNADDYGIHIASMIYDNVYKKYGPNIDITKVAFELENKWNNRLANNTVAAKGQIYTHTMMKDLIIEILSTEIKGNNELQRCYDPTCGTGGFGKKFFKFCEKENVNNVIVYENEVDMDCSNMAWIEGLCSLMDVRTFNKDCFDPELRNELIKRNSIDYLLMNPPYGMNKGKFFGFPKGFTWDEDDRDKSKLKPTEWTFCRYNMETFMKQGGWFAFVIPVSCVSENKQNVYDKRRMIQECEIWFVIKIREDIFTPQAGKACCIVMGRYVNGWRTNDEIKTWKTKCIDFTDDGGEIKAKKGEVEYDYQNLKKLWYERILNNKCLDGICERAGGVNGALNSILYEETDNDYYEEIVLTEDVNWIYTKREKVNINDQKLAFYTSIENRRHVMFMNIMNKFDTSKCSPLENNNVEWREVRIDELFELVKCKGYNTKDLKDGPYPLIMSVSTNNGIQRYVDKWCVDTEEIGCPVITVPVTGSVGYCFVQKGKFCVSDNVPPNILKPTDKYKFIEDDLVKIAFLMTQKFTKIYSYSTKLNNSRLMNETVILPFDKRNDEIVDLNKICCIHANDKFSRFDEMMMKMNEELNALEKI